jgi:enamine deaminase RidA (YjgF/YER057c/UK114 family)
VGAVTPHDPETGRLVTALSEIPASTWRGVIGGQVSDTFADRAFAQAWRAYETLRQTLVAHGSSPDRLLRQRLFLADLRDLPVVRRVMDLVLPGPKPATAIVEIPRDGIHPSISLQLDAIALAGDSAGAVQTIELPDLAPATGGYPAATRAGPFLFLSNTVGTNPATGRLATSMADLGGDARRFAEAGWTRAEDAATLAQTWWIFRHLGAVLASQGASLGDLLKLNGWLAFDQREFGPVATVRGALSPSREVMPASSSLAISALAPHARLGYEAIALVPDLHTRKDVGSDPGRATRYYVFSVRGGPLVFTFGELPVDMETRRVIEGFDQLDEPGRLLPFGRIHPESGIQARAWFVYQRHRAHLAAYGAAFPDVVHQTVFLSDPAEYPALERVATLFFGPELPPTTVVPIRPGAPIPGARLEIELVAATPSGVGGAG